MNYQIIIAETDKNVFFTANLIKDGCRIKKYRSTLPFYFSGGDIVRAAVVKWGIGTMDKVDRRCCRNRKKNQLC
ncbi:hypothetical protein ASZ90_008419 [hydrocarbon metagenome]|uniref:Uncharacterized protein n=1 Tax=hydrocarbon metagenome TaxID=938273 RepID=A0A0W8FME8_9ZZZZ